MLDVRIQRYFFDGADALNQHAEQLGRALSTGSAAIIESLTAGSKLLVSGGGSTYTLAQHLVNLFVTGLERERPPLAAMLTYDYTTPPVIPQLQAFGHPGDVLIYVSLGHHPRATRALLTTAHEQDLTVIAMMPAAQLPLFELLKETDIAIALPETRMGRLLELALISMHCLCEAVDNQLLGEPIV